VELARSEKFDVTKRVCLTKRCIFYNAFSQACFAGTFVILITLHSIPVDVVFYRNYKSRRTFHDRLFNLTSSRIGATFSTRRLFFAWLTLRVTRSGSDMMSVRCLSSHVILCLPLSDHMTQICVAGLIAASAVPQDRIPLQALKQLVEHDVPNYDMLDAFEPLLGAQVEVEEAEPLAEETQTGANDFSLIDAQSQTEAQRAAAQELQFARIQFLQAAIAEKKAELQKQKDILNEEINQLKREKELVAVNRRIVAENERQIALAQAELANLLESYSQNVKSSLSLDAPIPNKSRKTVKKAKKAAPAKEPKPAAAAAVEQKAESKPAQAEEAPEIFVEVDAETDLESEAEANLAEADHALEAMMALHEDSELM